METKTESVVIFSKGGTKERSVPVSSIQIPDLWHLALAQDDPRSKDAILQVWHMAHDLLRHIRENS